MAREARGTAPGPHRESCLASAPLTRPSLGPAERGSQPSSERASSFSFSAPCAVPSCPQPGFEFIESHNGYVEGYRRRFWQGSPEHRGRPDSLGRVVTLVPAGEEPADDEATLLAAKAPGVDAADLHRAHGTLYRISAAVAEDTFAALLHRERAGYGLRSVRVHCQDGVVRDANVFWGASENEFFVGAQPAADIAKVIATSAGQSGPNVEYFARLLAAMRRRGTPDPHLEAVAAAFGPNGHADVLDSAVAAASAEQEPPSDPSDPLSGARRLAAAGPRSFPLGSAVPAGDQHSVVVSLPTVAHCEGYEEGDPAVTSLVRHGYPRFVVHSLLLRLHDRLAAELSRLAAAAGAAGAAGAAAGPEAGAQAAAGLCGEDVLSVCSERAGRELAAYCSAHAACCGEVAVGLEAAVARCGRREPGGPFVLVSTREVAGFEASPEAAWAVVLPLVADRARPAEPGAGGTATAGDAAASAKEGLRSAAKAFLQHTGVRSSSREAEALLGALAASSSSSSVPPSSSTSSASASAEAGCDQCHTPAGREAAEARLRGSVVDAMGGGIGSDDVALCRSGMNAFYAAFKAVNDVMRPRGRRVWLQIGWLYVDTTMVLERFSAGQALCAGWPASDWEADARGEDGSAACSGGGATPDAAASGGGAATEPVSVVRVLDPTDDAAIAAAFAEHGASLAGVITETPSNPLVQSVDLAQLRDHCDACGAALVVDPTVASPFAVDVLTDSASGGPLADLVALSLTKYFGSDGSVMAGALARNPRSPLLAAPPGLWARAAAHAEPSGAADLACVAGQCEGAREVVETGSATCAALARYLESRSDCVESVHWALQAAGGSGEKYRRLARPGGAGSSDPLCGSVLSVVLKGGLEAARAFYDALDAVKGPSFGIGATLACPFALLAHYDLVTSEDGRKLLDRAGLSPWVIRISCGMEPTAAVLAAVERALPPRPSA